MNNKVTPVFPLIKGKTSRQAHTMLPEEKGKTTYEEEIGRQGFFGKATHFYHINPPTNWTNIEGDFKPELIDTNKIEPTDKSDPWGYPKIFLRNSDVQLWVSKRTEPMPYYYKNTEGDDIWFVHKGEGDVQTVFGHMTFKTGDYLIFPRGTFYKIMPTTKDNHFLIIESKEEINIPDRYILGPNALYDPAIIETPEPNPLENGGMGQESYAIYKRKNKYTKYTYPNDVGRNVTGWKGDVSAWKLSIFDFRPIMSHRYHLPPSAHSTFISQGFVVCSFVPRPFETADDAIKIPFYHSNVEYDEIIFYHEGNFFSRDNIEPGLVTFHPAGFTHGPHPNALKKMLKQDKTMTNEYAVMVDTKNPLEIPEDIRNTACDPEYWKSWQAAGK